MKMPVKLPTSEQMLSVSMLVPHDPAENLALASATVDKVCSLTVLPLK